MVRLPQFDFVAVGIVYPGEAAVAFVLALRVDVDASFARRSSSASRSSTM